jgi:hypothetical protein
MITLRADLPDLLWRCGMCRHLVRVRVCVAVHPPADPKYDSTKADVSAYCMECHRLLEQDDLVRVKYHVDRNYMVSGLDYAFRALWKDKTWDELRGVKAAGGVK